MNLTLTTMTNLTSEVLVSCISKVERGRLRGLLQCELLEWSLWIPKRLALEVERRRPRRTAATDPPPPLHSAHYVPNGVGRTHGGHTQRLRQYVFIFA